MLKIKGKMRLISESCPAIQPNGDVSVMTTTAIRAFNLALSSGGIEMTTNESSSGVKIAKLNAYQNA